MKFSGTILASIIMHTVCATDEKARLQKHVRRGLKGHTHQDDEQHKHQPRAPKQSSTVTHFTLNQGDNDNDKDIRIVGGSQSAPGEFPYYVELDGCGGSLIAPNAVLTAAHCGSYKGKEVIVGAYRSGSTQNNAVRATVVSEVRHPKYNDDTTANDFHLLRLNKDVTVGGSNVVLSVNDQYSNPANGASLTVLGLGITSEGGGSPNILRDVQVKAIGTNICNREEAYDGDVIDSNMFCAGVSGGGKDSCQGDSGGPIVKRMGNKHVQVGIVSWGDGCARPDHPGVYARVSSAYDWIEGVVCDQWKSDASFCNNSGGGNNGSSSNNNNNNNSNNGGGDSSPPPSGSGSCLPITLNVRTDDYGDDTDLFLLTDSGDLVWNANGFSDNKKYQFSTCLDRDECATLDIFDSWGDGIKSPGGIKLTVDGKVQYNGGSIGGGVVFRLGDGC